MSNGRSFWDEAFALHGSVTRRVLPTSLAFGVFAYLIYLLYKNYYPNLPIEVGPHEVGGALLGVLLVLRTNAGLDRWWEARKLWGGIVNQSRNLALLALAHGPAERGWRERMVRWTAAFPYAAKARLRGEAHAPELAPLLGAETSARMQTLEHMPSGVAWELDELLRDACERGGMDRWAFLQAERERCALLDHLGGCERIRKTPLATVYSITIRRFITIFLATLPFALLHKFEEEWLAPLTTLMVAYAVLALDQIGIELQQPFAQSSLSHLPLDEICDTIEKNLLALLHQTEGRSACGDGSIAGTPGIGGARSGPG